MLHASTDFLTEATGRAERDAAMLMAEAIPPGKRVTLGGDKSRYATHFIIGFLRLFAVQNIEIDQLLACRA